MKRTTVPDVIEQVALVTGKILHEGTGKPVVGTIRVTSEEYSIIDRVLNDGTFVLSGQLELLFPQLSLRDYQLHLTIRVTSLQFQQGYIQQSLTVTIPQGWNFEQPVSKVLPTSTSTILVLLPADSVFIRGYVFDRDDPGIGIPNATVTVKQGANTFTTLTSAEAEHRGKYSFQDAVDPAQLQAFKITATNPITMSCSATGFKSITDRSLVIDFGQPLHEEYFHLVHENS